MLTLLRPLLPLALALAALSASSHPLGWRIGGAPGWATPEDNRAAELLWPLCMDIGKRTRVDDPQDRWRYKAISNVIRAAGLPTHQRTLTPAQEEQLRSVWVRFESRGLLICNNTQFEVPNGSMLKYAASTQFDAFIRFAAEFKLGATHYDESDNRTVMDYLRYSIDRHRGTPSAKGLQDYYDTLRKAGFKHRAELP